MRNFQLNPVEAAIVHAVLNQGDPQRGLTMQEVRAAIPVLDKLEANAEQKEDRLFFKEQELALKEVEYALIKQKLENSTGWLSVAHARQAVLLLDRLEEVPPEV